MILLIKPSANVCVFGDFAVHHKDWLTYSCGTNISGELCYDISISNKLLRWVTFLLGSQTVILTVLLFWLYFFLLILLFVVQWLFHHWEILIMFFCQFPLTFYHIHNGISCFIALLMSILVLIGMVFVIIWETFHGRMSLTSVLLLLVVNFFSVFRLELMYISLIVCIRSSLTHLHGFQLLLMLP